MPLEMQSSGDPRTDHTDLAALNAALQEGIPSLEGFPFEIRVGRVGMRSAGPTSTTRKYVEQALPLPLPAPPHPDGRPSPWRRPA